jgi:hypothetical protein
LTINNIAFANILARGFANHFGVINKTFMNILARGFVVDFNFIDNIFDASQRGASTLSSSLLATCSSTFLQRGFVISFGVTDTTFANIFEWRDCHWHLQLCPHRQLE